MQRLIYIPVEVAKREALPKSFLAAALAERGATVFIFEDYLFDRYGYLGKGSYLGKNVFKTEVPYSLKHYQSLKEQGIVLYYLDEEGGIYAGPDSNEWEKTLVARTDPKTLDHTDHYLSWGLWQAAVFQSRSRAFVHITGSPNYEICKPTYQKALATLASSALNNSGQYILVNTRFSYANPMAGLGELIGGNSPASKCLSADWYHNLLASDFQYLGAFIKLIQLLADQYANITIVLRPHPAENHELYAKLFAHKKNVIVNGTGHIATWLANAAVVIHNGCSTAVQAVLARKPVITYLPFDDTTMDVGLPNRVGIPAKNEREVVALVRRALDSTLEVRNSAEVSSTIADVSTFQCVADLVIQGTPQACEDVGKMGRIACSVFVRRALRSLARRGSVFDRKEFERIPTYIALASQYYSLDLEAARICRGLYRINRRHDIN